MAITNIYKGDVERSDIQKIYKGTTLLYEKVLPPSGPALFYGGGPPNTVIKANLGDLSTLNTVDYGDYTYAIAVDDTHIYVGGSTTKTVRKYLKSNLSYIGQTASYGGEIWSIAVDDTHIYAGGGVTKTVRKYLKSNLSYIGETPNYGGYIYAIAIDDTHIYVGGSTTRTVRKYLKSNLSYIGGAPSYGGNIESITIG